MENNQNNAYVVRGYNKTEWEELSKKTVFNGNLVIIDIKVNEHHNEKIKPLALKKINGNLIVLNCIMSNQLSNLMQVSGGAVIMNTNIANLKNLKEVGGRFEINCSNVVDLTNLVHVGKDFILDKGTVQKSNVRYVDGNTKVVERTLPEQEKYFEQ